MAKTSFWCPDKRTTSEEKKSLVGEPQIMTTHRLKKKKGNAAKQSSFSCKRVGKCRKKGGKKRGEQRTLVHTTRKGSVKKTRPGGRGGI